MCSPEFFQIGYLVPSFKEYMYGIRQLNPHAPDDTLIQPVQADHAFHRKAPKPCSLAGKTRAKTPGMKRGCQQWQYGARGQGRERLMLSTTFSPEIPGGRGLGVWPGMMGWTLAG